MTYQTGNGVCTAPLNYLHIDTPVSGTTTSNGTILVQGTVLPSANVQTVTINGVPATLSGSVFTATVPLQPGQNTLAAVATSIDSDCSEMKDVVTVTRTG